MYKWKLDDIKMETFFESPDIFLKMNKNSELEL
jgi:hypothetical protein